MKEMVLDFDSFTPGYIYYRLNGFNPGSDDDLVLQAPLVAVGIEHITQPQRRSQTLRPDNKASFFEYLTYRGLLHTLVRKDAASRKFPGEAKFRITGIARAEQQNGARTIE